MMPPIGFLNKYSLASQNLCPPSIDGIASFITIAALSIPLLAFLYLLGRATQNPQREIFAKVEIFEYFHFIVLIVLVFPILLGIGCIDLFGNGINTYEAGYKYWEVSYNNLEKGGYVVQLTAGLLAAQYAVNVGVAGSSGPAVSGVWEMVSKLLSTNMVGVALGLGLAKVMVVMYQFLTYGIYKALLPLGLVLRAFPYTRKIGGTIIGLVLGSLLFLPLISAVMFNVVYDSLPIKYVISPQQGVGAQAQPTGSYAFSADMEEYLGRLVVFGGSYTPQKLLEEMSNEGDNLVNSANPTGESSNIRETTAKLSSGFALGGLGLSIISRAIPDSWVNSPNAPARLRTFARFVKGIGTWGASIGMVSLALYAFAVVMPGLSLVLGVNTLLIIVLLTSMKVFTGLFGEPLDVGNLTRLI